MISHRSAGFDEIFTSIASDLDTLFETRQHTFVMTATGTGMMEAALENCVGRRVLVTSCGAFGDRWYSIAESLGVEVDRLAAPWGQAIDPDDLADHLARHRTHYDAVTITHNETSTGVTNDVAALASIVREESPDTLVLVDAVSSLGGMPLHFDDWGIDVCFASSQKCLGLPPGITVVAVSEAAVARARKHPYRGTYFDLLPYVSAAADNTVPSTPSIPHFYALAKQLDHILREEGLEARFARHREMSKLTIERTARFARPAAEKGFESATVTALSLASDPQVLIEEMKRRGYILGDGYGDWKKSTVRIGHMGDTPVADLRAMLDEMLDVMKS